MRHSTIALISLFSIGCSCGMSPIQTGTDDLVGTVGDGNASTGDGPIQSLEGGIVIKDDGGTFNCQITKCNGKILLCGNCLDDDGDGLVDFRDPECLGPCDNTEGPELTAGIGGQTGGPCKADCYFDFGNGAGNDDCHWDHRCDPLAIPPDYPPEGMSCAFNSGMVGSKDCPTTQSKACGDFCRPLTPNGCDCFGCCTFPQLNGGNVWIGAMDSSNAGTCTFAKILDPKACPPCTPVAACWNDCGKCELCIGKTTLPPECFPDGGVAMTDGPPPLRCQNGEQPCGLSTDPDCAVGYYCITGCCQLTIQ